MTAFYNDTDAYCGAWLRNLIGAGHITPGTVDERSICEIQPEDVIQHERVHLFAGIAGWDYALRLAGWPAGVPVWTGSCPCQPFSCAGKGLGAADERHLWPEMFRLIRECRPGVVFGEQVASAVGHGWLDGIFADLEGLGYACWATVAGAHSVGAPHIRQRLYWVAISGEYDGQCIAWQGNRPGEEVSTGTSSQPHRRGNAGRVAVTEGIGLQIAGGEPGCSPKPSSQAGGVADASRRGQGADWGAPRRTGHLAELQQAGWNGGDRWWLCRDGKQRRIPAEPFYEFTFDGLSCIMGSDWDNILDQIKTEVTHYAKKADARPGEILRAMWCETLSKALRGNAGGYDTIPESPLLLFALCQLTRDTRNEPDFSASNFAAIKEITLRIMWENTRGVTVFACPSYQRGLDGPPRGEPADALCRLSPNFASKESESVLILRSEIAQTQNVPETLSAVEEIWRSVFDEDKKAWDSARIRTGADAVRAMDCFPLSKSIPGRVGQLRAAGNSIVPKLAAEFIETVMEAMWTN